MGVKIQIGFIRPYQLAGFRREKQIRKTRCVRSQRRIWLLRVHRCEMNAEENPQLGGYAMTGARTPQKRNEVRLTDDIASHIPPRGRRLSISTYAPRLQIPL